MKRRLLTVLLNSLFFVSLLSQSPTVDSYSPADNATDVVMRPDLTINFSESVTVGSGSITIHKSSDNSIIETIDVTGSQVSGGGTSKIFIDVNQYFELSTAYYVQIESGCFIGYSGISDNTTWNFTTAGITKSIQRRILASGGASSDYFGKSVAMSGNYAIVGSPSSNSDIGSAYVYDITTGEEVYNLTPSDGEADDGFGESVAISGRYAVVGAPNKTRVADEEIADDYDRVYAGAVYVYDLNTGAELNKIIISDGFEYEYFGSSVSVSDEYIVVGSYGYWDGDLIEECGCAYVFETNTGVLLNTLLAEDRASNDHLGWSVYMSGNYVLIGANNAKIGRVRPGAAYMFDLSTGSQLYKCTGSDTEAGDLFGQSVSISDNYVVVGAPNNNGYTGGVYVYTLSAGTFVKKLTASDGITNDEFGYSISSVGDYLIVGAYGDDNTKGSVYVYELSSLTQVNKITATDGNAADSFGWGISISGNYAIIGAHEDDDNGYNSGSIYVVDFLLQEGLLTWVGGTTGSESSWNATTNWFPTLVPTSTDDIIIPVTGNQPIINNAYGADAEVLNASIESGATLTVAASSALTINGDLNNAGSVLLEANSVADERSGSLITYGAVTNTGTMTLYRNVKGSGIAANDYTWHSIGIPVESTPAVDFFTGDYMYGYVESTNGWGSTPTTVERGTGYILKTVNGDKTYEFTGTFNSGDYSYDVVNSGLDSDHGYNFVSNPYPSQIDLDNLTLTNISMFYAWDPETSTYLSYQIGTGGGLGNILESCQGFFVKVSNSSSTGNVTFKNDARISTTSGSTLKSNSVSTMPRIIIKVSNGEYEDVLMVNETDIANEGYKLFSFNPDAPQIYAIDDTKDYCIYNKNVIVEDDVIPIGFKTNADGVYTVNVTEQSFEGLDVALIDMQTTEVIPIAAGTSFEIAHTSSNDEQRFELIFKPTETTAVNDVAVSTVKIYSVDNNVVIKSTNIFDYTIYTLDGKTVKVEEDKQGTEYVPLSSGLYLVKVTNENKVLTQKVLIK